MLVTFLRRRKASPSAPSHTYSSSFHRSSTLQIEWRIFLVILRACAPGGLRSGSSARFHEPHRQRSMSSTTYGGTSSTDSIRRFTGYQGTLVRVNDLNLTENCVAEPKLNIQEISLEHVRVISEIDCLQIAGHGFVSSRVSYPVGDEEITRMIAPTKSSTMVFPLPLSRLTSTPAKLSVDITNTAGLLFC